MRLIGRLDRLERAASVSTEVQHCQVQSPAPRLGQLPSHRLCDQWIESSHVEKDLWGILVDERLNVCMCSPEGKLYLGLHPPGVLCPALQTPRIKKDLDPLE